MLFVLLGGHIRLEVTVEKLNGVEAVYQREYEDLYSEPAKAFKATFEKEVLFSEVFMTYYSSLTVLQEHFFTDITLKRYLICGLGRNLYFSVPCCFSWSGAHYPEHATAI